MSCGGGGLAVRFAARPLGGSAHPCPTTSVGIGIGIGNGIG